MVVDPDEARRRERLRHQDRRRAVAAADVGDERRRPRAWRRRRRAPAATRPRGTCGSSTANARSVPCQRPWWCSCQPTPSPFDEPLGAGARATATAAFADWNVPVIEERARLVGEHERVLGRQHVRRRLRVVDDEAARRLGVEPLAHVALLRAGARGQLRRRDGLAVGHGLVEAELVAERHERRVERGAQLGGGVADEGLELLLVDVGDRHDQRGDAALVVLGPGVVVPPLGGGVPAAALLDLAEAGSMRSRRARSARPCRPVRPGRGGRAERRRRRGCRRRRAGGPCGCWTSGAPGEGEDRTSRAYGAPGGPFMSAS